VLVVCTANYTRSPYIAADLQRRVGGRLTVESAGTRALRPNSGADRRLLPHVGHGGVDPADLDHHRPRQLTRQMILTADLVITATREIRGIVDSMAPGTTDRVYTLLELAKLLEDIPPTSEVIAASFLDLVSSRRTRDILADPSTDLTDPRGEAPEAYWHMVDTVNAALNVIEPALVSAPSTGAPGTR
jgi:protein-tyrosine phosphatase